MEALINFATYSKVKPPEIDESFFNKSEYQTLTFNDLLNTYSNFRSNSSVSKQEESKEETQQFNPFIQDIKIVNSPQKSKSNTQSISKHSIDNDLVKIDIEDLLKSEGITSINGKKIKFGNRNLRSLNSSIGAKNSNHKKKDPHTGNAMARDISIEGGNINDYNEFRRVLLSNNRIRQYMQNKNWGIINEVTPQILSQTKGTGMHFHFGPDTWAKKTWNNWVKDPNVSITKSFKDA